MTSCSLKRSDLFDFVQLSGQFKFYCSDPNIIIQFYR